MSDPISNPLPTEDDVYVDVLPIGVTAPKSAKPQIEARQRERDRARNEIAAVLATEAGQAVIMRVLDFCRVYKQTVHHDPSAYGLAEGRRAVGLWLIEQILDVNPELYPQLLLNHMKRKRSFHAVDLAIAENRRELDPGIDAFRA